MKAVAGLIAAALVAGACSVPVTETGSVARSEAAPTGTDWSVEETVYLAVIVDAVDTDMSDAKYVELGYIACDVMVQAYDLGLSLNEYLSTVLEESADMDQALIIAAISGTAVETLCVDELRYWR